MVRIENTVKVFSVLNSDPYLVGYIAHQSGVSKATVRRALNELVASGLAVRVDAGVIKGVQSYAYKLGSGLGDVYHEEI